METYETAGPKCPYCGHLHRDLEDFMYDESLTKMDCEHCDKTFNVRAYTSTSWTCTARETGA